MIEFLSVFGVVLVAAVLAGGSSGVLGVFVVGMQMPFLAICTAHSALAGAVLASFAGIPSAYGAFLGACIGAVLLLVLLRRREIDMNAALGILFSLTIGLALLGIGLSPGAKGGMFSLLWGSILFVSWPHVAIMLAIGAVLAVFLLLFGQQLKLILFSRALATLMIHEGLLMAGLILLISAIIALNIEIVGGLLVFSLLSNPAIAALRISRSLGMTFFLSALFGILSAVGGFIAAYIWNLPAGACIVLVSCSIVAATMLPKRRIAK